MELRTSGFVLTGVLFSSRIQGLCFVLLAIAASVPLRAEVAFSKILTPAECAIAGFNHLTTPQRTALDALIQRDLDAARQGNVTGFAKTFTERRSPEERQRSGIAQMTDAERVQLDRLVAAVMAARPVLPYVPRRPTPESSSAVTLEQPKPEVHGEVSAFYGANSRGGSWYGGSFDAVMIDPSKKYAIGIGISEVRARGAHGCFDGPIW